MAQQNIENICNMCKDQLKHYTTQLNDDMGPNRFKVEYKVVDKMPIGVIYILIIMNTQHTEEMYSSLLCTFLRKLLPTLKNSFVKFKNR